MYVTAIVPAAGRGVRLKSKASKPLVSLGNKPLFIQTLLAINRHPLIQDIIVVANASDIVKIRNGVKKYNLSKVKAVVLGGPRRQDSVARGLKAISHKADLVLVHDAARPFISQEAISAAVKTADNFGAAIVGVPVKATIKRVTSQRSQVTSVKETLDRRNLWEIQTPQVFKKDLILKAYKKFGSLDVTDDSMLVEKLGVGVKLVLGSYNNIKITTPEDLILAKVILSRK